MSRRPRDVIVGVGGGICGSGLARAPVHPYWFSRRVVTGRWFLHQQVPVLRAG